MTFELAAIVAMGERNVIGKNNAMPWHLPGELKCFKNRTMGYPLIMGRNTFESIGKPLPGRTNIVVTRQPHWRAEGVAVAHSLDQAIELAQQCEQGKEKNGAMVIGGAMLYEQALARCSKLYVTQVHGEFDGDAFFPQIPAQQWRETFREKVEADEKNAYAFSIVVLERTCFDGNPGHYSSRN